MNEKILFSVDKGAVEAIVEKITDNLKNFFRDEFVSSFDPSNPVSKIPRKPEKSEAEILAHRICVIAVKNDRFIFSKSSFDKFASFLQKEMTNAEYQPLRQIAPGLWDEIGKEFSKRGLGEIIKAGDSRLDLLVARGKNTPYGYLVLKTSITLEDWDK